MSDSIHQIYDFALNIKDKVKPSEKDKETLLLKLNKQLNEEEHLQIFTEILQNLEKRIYSMTENGTLFDLNDLPYDAFWKIAQMTYLCIQNHERQKVIDQAKAEQQLNEQQQNQEFKDKLDKLKNKPEQINEPIDQSQLTQYEKLRINALSQCGYSNYSKSYNQTTNTNGISNNDKKIEKTIYSDSFKHKWKLDDKKNQPMPKIELKNTPVCPETPIQSKDIEHGNDDNDDEDEDDMMVNEDDADDLIDGINKEELDKLKSQLLKPKTKLTLKCHSYQEDLEDED